MTSLTPIGRLISILMIAAFALAPVSRPAMAGLPSGAPAAVVADQMAAAMTDEMAGDMPCCPSKSDAPVDCDTCILMAACMTKCFAGTSAAAFEPLFAVTGSLLLPQNDFWPDGMGHPPPDHPPRHLI